jgi:hypothetical protein
MTATRIRTVANGEVSPDAMRAYRAAKALHRDGGSPASAFGLLAAIVDDRTWERLTDNCGRPFANFTAFVEGAEPGGLGTTKRELRKLLVLQHPNEDGAPWNERAPRLRQQISELLGADIEPAGRVGRPEAGKGGGTTFTDVERNSANHITARLKRDDPELAERVVAGEISPNAAAHEKGWRKPRIVLTSPRSVADRIREHFTPDQISELIHLLTEEP